MISLNELIILMNLVKMSQQGGSLQFDSGNLTNILVILLIIGLGVYVYFELQKIKNRLSEIENRISQSPIANEPMIQTSRVNIQDNRLGDNDPRNMNESEVSPANEFTPLPNDEQGHGNSYKQINIQGQQEQQQYQEQKELSEDEIQALMDDEPLSDISDDNQSNASSDVMGVLASLGPTKKPEEPEESLNMDEDNIPEEIFENIQDAIENITNLSEQAAQKDTEEVVTDTNNAEKDYSKMTVNQLKTILTDLNLPTSGNKTKLIERIQQNKSLKI
tara:strand:+ start:6372 stop:7199 length:828 start_codon:yes stop_codon:yes gene_type:complete